MLDSSSMADRPTFATNLQEVPDCLFAVASSSISGTERSISVIFHSRFLEMLLDSSAVP